MPVADRAIWWEGFYNARDLGGLPTISGAATRYGVLIRSADPRFVTAVGWQSAVDAGFRTVLDLRNDDEAEPGSIPNATLDAGTFAVPGRRRLSSGPRSCARCGYHSMTSMTSPSGGRSIRRA
jgi:hypothetical protein